VAHSSFCLIFSDLTDLVDAIEYFGQFESNACSRVIAFYSTEIAKQSSIQEWKSSGNESNIRQEENTSPNVPKPPSSDSTLYRRSPILPLPQHLDGLIGSPWTGENSRQVDRWLWYIEQEFETVGGWQ
jgi:hypothetical protein